MNELFTWHNKARYLPKTIKLYKNKVAVIQHFNNNDVEKIFTFNKFLNYKYTIASAEIDCKVLQNIVKQEKPNDLDEFAEKTWDFWSNFNNEHIDDEKIFVDEDNFLFKSKYGFAWGYYDAFAEKDKFYSWQRHDNFFFFGPFLFNVPLKKRISLKKEIFKLIDKNKSKLTLNDGFLLFDYNEIEELELEKIDGIRASYFKIIEGKVTAGGWDNPMDGGENYSSVEYLWYNMKNRVPEDFRDEIPYITHILEKAIIDETTPKGNYKKKAKNDLDDKNKPGAA